MVIFHSYVSLTRGCQCCDNHPQQFALIFYRGKIGNKWLLTGWPLSSAGVLGTHQTCNAPMLAVGCVTGQQIALFCLSGFRAWFGSDMVDRRCTTMKPRSAPCGILDFVQPLQSDRHAVGMSLERRASQLISRYHQISCIQHWTKAWRFSSSLYGKLIHLKIFEVWTHGRCFRHCRSCAPCWGDRNFAQLHCHGERRPAKSS